MSRDHVLAPDNALLKILLKSSSVQAAVRLPRIFSSFAASAQHAGCLQLAVSEQQGTAQNKRPANVHSLSAAKEPVRKAAMAEPDSKDDHATKLHLRARS